MRTQREHPVLLRGAPRYIFIIGFQTRCGEQSFPIVFLWVWPLLMESIKWDTLGLDCTTLFFFEYLNLLGLHNFSKTGKPVYRLIVCHTVNLTCTYMYTFHRNDAVSHEQTHSSGTLNRNKDNDFIISVIHQYYIIKAYKLLAERTVKRSKLRKDNIFFLRCVCLCHAA